MESSVRTIIENASDRTISALIIDAYKEVEKYYYLKQWITSELESGHFVEAVRRLIEFKLFGSYTSIGRSLSNFNDTVLQRYENGTGDEAYRLIIPRVLYSIYSIRNKRGVGHVSMISPNHQDATYILSSSKWILAEIVRIESTFNPNITLPIVEKIIERDIEGIWEEGDIIRILEDDLTLRESILFLLFKESPMDSKKLQEIIESKDSSYFKRNLKELHSKRLIEYKKDETCILSPKGRKVAEEIVLKLKQ